MDLFDDLPEPTQTGTQTQATNEEEEEEKGRKVKRKREEEEEDDDEEEEKKKRGVDEKEEKKKVCSEGVPVLRGYVAARRGERDEMQDAHVLLPELHTCRSLTHGCGASYFAVFDGHGGARASRFAAEHLHLNLLRRLPQGESENSDRLIKKCLVDTFRQTDEDFLKKASSQKPAWKDGSTATCVLVLGHMVYVANLGDSRAVLCRMEAGGSDGQRRPLTLALSKEHNPTMYEERMRIQRAGGSVRDGRVLGVLEVSRSIGDGQFKRCGVISAPDLRRCRLSANDRFLVLACDGLFKVFSADEAVKFVLGVLQEEEEGGRVEQGAGPVLQGAGPVAQGAGLPEEEARFEAACQQLASEAVRRGCADNVTVILVSISFTTSS